MLSTRWVVTRGVQSSAPTPRYAVGFNSKTSVAVSPWMISSSILLLPMRVLAACHLDNNLPPALLNPLDKQVSCQSLRIENKRRHNQIHVAHARQMANSRQN
jgi:hypothetical protein